MNMNMNRSLVIRAITLHLLFISTTASPIEYDIKTYKAKWADQRATAIGDMLTVLIQETAKASSSAGLDADNKHSVGISNQLNSNTFELDSGLSGSMVGESSTSRNGSISATITARVIGIDQHHMFKIFGEQYVTVNGEEQKITITGFVRPEDLSAQNLVVSSRIESANIELSGIGEVNDNRNPNVFRLLFRWLGF
ncbi:flagellar basal body L-ring protein FlgH [Vibrio lentus]|uniref:flagellar basal body L-ring protein FlgH n=2 Tax=Vibrio TaxID=662 RepID=UPI00247A1E3A|nr:flagellar basal body L-ring protein FlgH [Vibrio lentus]WGS63057.1 flagellar basal body L-ring protein FlgH [Vibrio lentus]